MRSEASRRTFLGRALAGLGLVAVGRGVARAQEVWARIAGLPPEITPVGKFYTVSKNVFDPSVDGKSWRLQIKGKVEQPYSLTLEELRQLPAVEKPYTLMCISNEVGGELISNATWKGVPLKPILERAGIKPGATELILRARDGYSDSFPLEAALREGTILAYEMNGHPLAKQHGYPARVLVMGIYGMKNVKWLTELEVADYDYKGYWESRGWSDTAIYKSFSRIDVPQAGQRLKPGTPTWIAGVAFAGDRGVRAVEVSADGGKTWQAARVKPALGNHTWMLWAFEWTPAPGSATLRVRVVDGTGAVQPAGPMPPLPDGAEGHHTISVRVT
ncbi:MAG: molybdopterin-dependent oxidoreductase [Candidatus Rokubacteria bacterium]|nr:molybdopterin-dependent oxidoreductase [Candidatus Rokubacteria bacterium]